MTDLEIVQEARERIEKNVGIYRLVITTLPDDLPISASNQLNSWLAHKAFFERHKKESVSWSGKFYCVYCWEINNELAEYPCPELVAQARLILGVAND